MNPSGFESRQRDVLSRGCATTDEEYLSELRDRVSVLDLIIRRRKAEKHIIREKIKEVEIEKGIDFWEEAFGYKQCTEIVLNKTIHICFCIIFFFQ